MARPSSARAHSAHGRACTAQASAKIPARICGAIPRWSAPARHRRQRAIGPGEHHPAVRIARRAAQLRAGAGAHGPQPGHDRGRRLHCERSLLPPGLHARTRHAAQLVQRESWRVLDESDEVGERFIQAHMTLSIGESRVATARAEGTGPVDALTKAMRMELDKYYPRACRNAPRHVHRRRARRARARF